MQLLWPEEGAHGHQSWLNLARRTWETAPHNSRDQQYLSDCLCQTLGLSSCAATGPAPAMHGQVPVSSAVAC